MATQALDVAKMQAVKIKSHKDGAERLVRNMLNIKEDATAGRGNVQDAFKAAWDTRNRSDAVVKVFSDMPDKILSMLDDSIQPTLTEVKDLAEEVLNNSIHLKPDEIRELANRITNSDRIISETANDWQNADTTTKSKDLDGMSTRTTADAETEKIKIVQAMYDLTNGKSVRDWEDESAGVETSRDVNSHRNLTRGACNEN